VLLCNRNYHLARLLDYNGCDISLNPIKQKLNFYNNFINVLHYPFDGFTIYNYINFILNYKNSDRLKMEIIKSKKIALLVTCYSNRNINLIRLLIKNGMIFDNILKNGKYKDYFIDNFSNSIICFCTNSIFNRFNYNFQEFFLILSYFIYV